MGEPLRVFSSEDVLGMGPKDVIMIADKMACRTDLMMDAERNPVRPIFFTLDSRGRVLMMDVPLDDDRTCYFGGVVDVPANWCSAGFWNNWNVAEYLRGRGI